ncbi:hypothetical protein PGRAT_02770 [Paenibacillus graminis]|uniref:Uncharacterized protein n=1 Tax=Paenibacillus graminis TaxID=189425 RepID=A0A089LYS6_9BACL|nr:hypothetical protein PGRAT_02770 [Paenibacillus graminis]
MICEYEKPWAVLVCMAGNFEAFLPVDAAEQCQLEKGNLFLPKINNCEIEVEKGNLIGPYYFIRSEMS